MKRTTIAATMALFAGAPMAAAAVNVLNVGGSYYTPILVNGTSAKYDIVFIGDGFTLGQQEAFNDAVDQAVVALQGRHPYSERMCAFNIWRVNVVSSQSGIDHPADSPPVFRNTELDCRYGNPAVGEAERCITSDSPGKCYEAAAFAPDADAVFVLVNDTQWGGCSDGLVFSSIATNFAQIITHELGHKIGALADEYTCYVCDGSDSGTTYSGPEPQAVNLTKQITLALIKWKDLIAPGTPLPTTVDSPVGVIGAWEGGGYAALGVYRPQRTCQMKESGQPFCGVCDREMERVLSEYCTACEIDPSSIACLIERMRDHLRYAWVEPTLIRWPVPQCLTCPPLQGNLEEIVYTLDGAPRGTELRIVDEAGHVVIEPESDGGRFVVGFQAEADRQYFVEVLTPANATGQVLDLHSTLTRDGTQQALP